MSNKLISTIIPTYNREKYIAEAIDSVLSQDYPNKEIIVVDDGSTDNTREIVAKYGSQVKCIHKENSGVALTRNLGVASANGDLIAWIDSDDYYLSEKLSVQAKYLDEHPEADIVFTKYENFVEGEVTPEIAARLAAETDNRYYMAASLTRRSLFGEIGNYDEKYKIGSDSDWIFRAKIVYGKNLDHYIDVPYYRRRFHTSNIVLSEPLDKNYNNRIMAENLKKKMTMGREK